MSRFVEFLAICLVVGCLCLAVQKRQSASAQDSPAVAPKPGPAIYNLDDGYLQWPQRPADLQYASIDGRQLHKYVEELAAISEHYRDSGHPQFWGRIEGTSSDEESAQWVADKFKAAGLDVHIQSFDLPPQWIPQSWQVSATADGKNVDLDTAFPGLRCAGTSGAGLDLEAVYVGLGNAADLAGKDLRGKAVFVYTVPEPGMWSHSAQYTGGVERVEQAGAAAVFLVPMIPGNVRYARPVSRIARPAAGAAADAQPKGVPEFSIGYEQAEGVRKMIEQGSKPHIQIKLDVKEVPGLKTSSVWGTLPGVSDEKVIVVAHRDGYFDGAGDNASGVATMVGLAEYFAKIPKSKRPRTLEFVGTAGHHGTAVSVPWMAANAQTALAKTALLMNAEHMALTQPYYFAGKIRLANTTTAEHWNFNGSPKLVDIATKAFGEFGVATYQQTDGVAFAEISAASRLVPSFGVINVDTYYHSDQETPEMVPWTGLGQVTRAFAEIIDGVNKVGIDQLLAPGMEEINPSPSGAGH